MDRGGALTARLAAAGRRTLVGRDGRLAAVSLARGLNERIRVPDSVIGRRRRPAEEPSHRLNVLLLNNLRHDNVNKVLAMLSSAGALDTLMALFTIIWRHRTAPTPTFITPGTEI